jgi:hypothetical protein
MVVDFYVNETDFRTVRSCARLVQLLSGGLFDTRFTILPKLLALIDTLVTFGEYPGIIDWHLPSGLASKLSPMNTILSPSRLAPMFTWVVRPWKPPMAKSRIVDELKKRQ